MVRRLNTVSVTVAVLAVATALVRAHHPLESEFDTTTRVEIRGQVVGFELMDPHSLLHVDVLNNDNTVTEWTIEGGAAHGIVAAGLTVEFLESRPMVRISAFPSKRPTCTPRCRAAGREFSFDGLNDPAARSR